VEDHVSDSQCGFRKGRGGMDMIFSARQLVEKVHEHEKKGFLIFVDLKKAYDTVPRKACWIVLKKYGVPDIMVKNISALHEGMTARVRLQQELSENIMVENGLRQGCTMAPTVFTLYFEAVMEDWRERCGTDLGVKLLFKMDGRMVKNARTTRGQVIEITDFEFADDMVGETETHAKMCVVAQLLVDVAAEWGLTVSIEKTKVMLIGVGENSEHLDVPVTVKGGGDGNSQQKVIESVKEFCYLGSIIEGRGGNEKDVQVRIAKASRGFGALRQCVFEDRHLSLTTKVKVYRCVVLAILLYGSETWVLKKKQIGNLENFHRRCMRGILGITRGQQWEQRIKTSEIKEKVGMSESMDDIIRQRRMRWLGHVARMGEERIPKRMLFGWLEHPRPAHGVKRRWKDVVADDLKRYGLKESEWYQKAQDREEWKALWKRDIGGSKGDGEDSQQQVEGGENCDLCGFWCKGSGQLRLHRGSERCNKLVSVARGAPQCPACHKTFKHAYLLERHLAVCGRGTRATDVDRENFEFECGACQKRFRQRGDLTRHVKRWCKMQK
jgi:hypothetical protein